MPDIFGGQRFCFTQQSLDTFVKCPLKFKKRYIEGLRWDSMPDEEARSIMDRGNSFHLLACRYFSDIPYGIYETTKDSELLAKWVRNLESFFVKRPDAVYLPEYSLRAELDGFCLEANFDLIAIEDGKVTIWDWKTHGPANEANSSAYGSKLVNSLQTKVYLFVLREQSSISGLKLTAGTPVSMKYWQPDPPKVIAGMEYNAKTHMAYSEYLRKLLLDIKNYDYTQFDKTVYAKHCRYCEFNWYCGMMQGKHLE